MKPSWVCKMALTLHAGRAGGIMKGWRMRVQCHVPSPLIPRPGLFTTTWSRHVNKDTWCFWVQSKAPSAHFLSSLAFYLLSTESQWNFPLRNTWISKTLTFPAHKKWCSDVDVCLYCLFCFFNQLICYRNGKLHSKDAIQCATFAMVLFTLSPTQSLVYHKGPSIRHV